MMQLIVCMLICSSAASAAPRQSDLRSSLIKSHRLQGESSEANYENYWVPLRAAMKRNMKQLEKATETLREKFAEFTNSSTSFEVAYIDLQIQECLETIDKLQKQLDRTPERVILPRDPSKPEPSSTTQAPVTTTITSTTTDRATTFVPPWRPPVTIIPPSVTWPPRPAPVTRPPSLLPGPVYPTQPDQSWFVPSGFPAIAGFLTIDTGANGMPAINKPSSFPVNWSDSPSFTDFLSALLG